MWKSRCRHTLWCLLNVPSPARSLNFGNLRPKMVWFWFKKCNKSSSNDSLSRLLPKSKHSFQALFCSPMGVSSREITLDPSHLTGPPFIRHWRGRSYFIRQGYKHEWWIVFYLLLPLLDSLECDILILSIKLLFVTNQFIWILSFKRILRGEGVPGLKNKFFI